MEEFFSMGGYAPFIWSSYGIGIGGLVVLAVISVRTLRVRERELEVTDTTQKKNVTDCDSIGTEAGHCQGSQGEGTVHES